MKLIPIIILLLLAAVWSVAAVPTPDPPTNITSNSFDIEVSGITGSEVWVMYGSHSPIHNWKTGETTVTGSNAFIHVVGGAMLSGIPTYFVVCDTSGCSDESSADLLAVTPIPTILHAEDRFKNITRSRFDPFVVGGTMVESVAGDVTSSSILFGGIFTSIFVGMWFRNKSTRLAGIAGVILSVFIWTASEGLMIGTPEVLQGLAVGVLAASIAGIVLSIVHR